MIRYYLLDYVKENFNLDKNILDALKYDLDAKIYYYGNQFKYPMEIKNESYFLKKMTKMVLRDFKFLVENFLSLKQKEITDSKKLLFHNYFNISLLYKSLADMNFNVYYPFWVRNRQPFDFNSFKKYLDLRNDLDTNNFNYLISENFFDKVKNFKEILFEKYKKFGFDGLVVPYDMPFFENISIQIFKYLQKPSFVFLHGLPGVYNNIDNNRADYLIVWGEKIKENFIKAGIDRNKIFVSGNPKYDIKNLGKNLRFSLENTLVITKSMNGSQHGDEYILTDRGNLILYLYQIQNVLKKLGVKTVRLRPHPSENINWYMKYLDRDFFKIDNENLQNSLDKSSLVIGPTSTVLLDSIFNGVNYLVYEPNVYNIDLTNYYLVPHFDGSDNRVPVAKNEDDLYRIITNKILIETSFIPEYISPEFDLRFMGNLI